MNLALHTDLLWLQVKCLWLWFELEEMEVRKNPDWHLQPRVPAGQPEGGRWTDGATPVNRRVMMTAAVAAVIKIVNRMRQPLIRALSLVPLPVTLQAPPLLGPNDHFRWEPSVRRPYMPYLEFDHYQQFLMTLLSAGTGYQWHHIVEQRMERIRSDGGLVFPPRSIHNSDNLILLPRDIHACISNYYSRRYDGDPYGRTLRNSLNNQPWSEHYRVGIRFIRRCQRETRSAQRRRAR